MNQNIEIPQTFLRNAEMTGKKIFKKNDNKKIKEKI